MRVTVVGSGFVGQTTAMRLVERGLAEVVLETSDGVVVFEHHLPTTVQLVPL